MFETVVSAIQQWVTAITGWSCVWLDGEQYTISDTDNGQFSIQFTTISQRATYNEKTEVEGVLYNTPRAEGYLICQVQVKGLAHVFDNTGALAKISALHVDVQNRLSDVLESYMPAGDTISVIPESDVQVGNIEEDGRQLAVYTLDLRIGYSVQAGDPVPADWIADVLVTGTDPVENTDYFTDELMP